MFGSRSAAVRRIDEREARRAAAIVRVGRLPASRQGGTGRVLMFAPREADVRVGNTCAGQAEVQQVQQGGQLQIPCENLANSQPKPLGGGDTPIPAGGVATATLLPVHPFIVIDYGINDPTGVALVTSIFAGTTNLMEGGSIRTNTWQSAKTACAVQKPFTIYPWSGIKFNFSNTTGQGITVNVWVVGYAVQC